MQTYASAKRYAVTNDIETEIMNNSGDYLCPHKYEIRLEKVVEEGYAFFIACIVINSVTCIPIAVINFLVIAVIFSTQTLQSPSNILICSLAMTDFIAGFVALPLYAISRVAEVKYYKEVFCLTWIISRVLTNWLTQASLLNLVAISLDRVLAAHVGLRYRNIVTKKRTVLLAVILWLFAAFLSCIRLFSSDAVFAFLGVGATIYVGSLVTMIVSYWKRYSSLRRHQKQTNKLVQASSHDYLNVLHYKRSINTMLYIVSLVLLCYLPFISLAFVVVFNGRTTGERVAWTIVDTIQFLNSFLNPIIYYWRIKEIRGALRSLIHLLVSKTCRCSKFERRRIHPTDLATSEGKSVETERGQTAHTIKTEMDSK